MLKRESLKVSSDFKFLGTFWEGWELDLDLISWFDQDPRTYKVLMSLRTKGNNFVEAWRMLNWILPKAT